MTQATFRVIVAEPSTAIDADRVSRRMTYRPTSRRQNRWKKAWTELSKEAVWLAIVQGRVLLEEVCDGGDPERVRREVVPQTGGLEPALHHAADVNAGHRIGGETAGLARGSAEERAIGDPGGKTCSNAW